MVTLKHALFRCVSLAHKKTHEKAKAINVILLLRLRCVFVFCDVCFVQLSVELGKNLQVERVFDFFIFLFFVFVESLARSSVCGSVCVY